MNQFHKFLVAHSQKIFLHIEDPGFEDRDVDVDDDEELEDKEGLTSGLKEIIERHMQGLKQKIEVFRRLADLEKEEEEEEENSS